MPTWAIALIVAAILVIACLAGYFILKVFNGPDGERYQKLRMQGPFVPVDDSEAGVDAVRSRSSTAQSEGRGDG